MASWRDDLRFRCPGCGRSIYLTAVESDEEMEAVCTIVAICIDCQHIFTSEEWRRRRVPHDPPDNADSRPGAR